MRCKQLGPAWLSYLGQFYLEGRLSLSSLLFTAVGGVYFGVGVCRNPSRGCDESDERSENRWLISFASLV